jgi:RimJ/RimL family protein N-acetyltransferase
MLRFYFDELGYQRCETGINAFNEPSLALHEKLGFTVEGVRRRAFYTQGRHHDVVMVSILDNEYRERHGHATTQ